LRVPGIIDFAKELRKNTPRSETWFRWTAESLGFIFWDKSKRVFRKSWKDI